MPPGHSKHRFADRESFLPLGPPTLSEALPPDVTALDAALWLVANHAELVRGVEGPRFGSWREATGDAAAEQALAIDRGLHRAWVEQTRARLDARFDSARDWADAALVELRATMLDAWRIPLHRGGGDVFPDSRDPGYWQMPGARLLRGLSNCDGMNLTLATLLTRWGPAELVDGGSHRFVRMVRFARCRGPVFADAFTNLPPFVIGPATGQAVRSDAEVLPAAAARHQRGAGEAPLDPRTYLLAPASLGVVRWRDQPAPWPADLPAPDVRQRPSAPPYLVARAHDLFGEPSVARRAYQEAIESERVSPALRHAARTFAARLVAP